MSESRPQTSNSLFRTSLRSWQASYKARQAEEAAPTADGSTVATAPVRVKRLAPHKRRAQRQAASRRS